MSSHNHKAYFILMSLEVGLIGIKYQGLDTNPFQQSSPTVFLCLTSLFCHTVTTMADMNFSVTIVTFHISGIVGCETLLWILLPVFWKWYIINQFLFVVTSFCFFNTIHTIAKLLPTNSIATAQPPDLELQEPPQPVQQSSNNIMHLFFFWWDDSFYWSPSIQCTKEQEESSGRKNMRCGSISTEENTSPGSFSGSDLQLFVQRMNPILLMSYIEGNLQA